MKSDFLLYFTQNFLISYTSFHIFPKLKKASNKNGHNTLLLLWNTLWLVHTLKIFQPPIESFFSNGFKANTPDKTDHILSEATAAFGKMCMGSYVIPEFRPRHHFESLCDPFYWWAIASDPGVGLIWRPWCWSGGLLKALEALSPWITPPPQSSNTGPPLQRLGWTWLAPAGTQFQEGRRFCVASARGPPRCAADGGR